MSSPNTNSKSHRNTLILPFILLLSLSLIFLSGCTGNTPDSNSNNNISDNKINNKKVTFVLDWTPNTNHTGLYVALSNGYFADAGLDVEIVQPPEDGAEMLVASGKAEFGISFQDTLAPAFDRETPLPITAVAAVIQHNTSGIISRRGEGIDTPAGLAAHKYATWDLPIEQATISHVMAADNGDFSEVELIHSTITDEVSALSSHSVDAIWIFYAWAGIACEVADLPTDYFAFADIDQVFDFYTPVIIANNDFLQNQPETAKAFIAAISRGYEFAANNPDAAADILLAAVPELSDESDLVHASQNYLANRYIADANRWGEFDPERWAAYYTWLIDNDLAGDNLHNYLSPDTGYTNRFLPEK